MQLFDLAYQRPSLHRFRWNGVGGGNNPERLHLDSEQRRLVADDYLGGQRFGEWYHTVFGGRKYRHKLKIGKFYLCEKCLFRNPGRDRHDPDPKLPCDG